MIEDPKTRRAIAEAARALASILDIEDLPPDVVDPLMESATAMVEHLAGNGAQNAACHLRGAAELDTPARAGAESLRQGRAIAKLAA
jgi:hypothetical protein